jgi:sugar lactone lactonase YvrE
MNAMPARTRTLARGPIGPIGRVRLGLVLIGAALVAAAGAAQDPEPEPAEHHRYEPVAGWLAVPPGELGSTHGDLVFDASGLLYVNTDTEDAVIVFDVDGKRVRAFGPELAGGLHGMCLVERDGRELLWLAHTGRHEVLQVTLEGQPVRTIPCPRPPGTTSRPTATARPAWPRRRTGPCS